MPIAYNIHLHTWRKKQKNGTGWHLCGEWQNFGSCSMWFISVECAFHIDKALQFMTCVDIWSMRQAMCCTWMSVCWWCTRIVLFAIQANAELMPIPSDCNILRLLFCWFFRTVAWHVALCRTNKLRAWHVPFARNRTRVAYEWRCLHHQNGVNWNLLYDWQKDKPNGIRMKAEASMVSVLVIWDRISANR